ncbi:hypothetical protein N474_01885 [Pseudoalteromonas luteoviolacea CPMOR-2]|uniref:Uncharacterized protein n=1 Tax=Pseudoalteromonas luteoviolacea DSM 6061 TaxID=1365250 RepID=A0A166WSE7_9GAMM|nr:hypothetical protein [Pseudoalteromonas luteoviolacea]KZN38022.1 hypothetical protein N475_15455 [Pseudoalteromonas luteoviolacea DSM 6061]KZN54494.1 hypothetical protein N474_01885 [Pseudoalteromonas luteoviolacea CPMOR-2]MBE0388965.1 hypothetical protein [Pseudoalteromonas luteoviolacea DSM 6061]
MEMLIHSLISSTLDTIVQLILAAVLWVFYLKLNEKYAETSKKGVLSIAKGSKYLSLSIIAPVLLSMISLLVLEDNYEHYIWYLVNLPHTFLTLFSVVYFIRGVRNFDL